MKIASIKMNQDDAGQKLLNIPHVVERLIMWLDPGSLLNLVHSKILSEEVLRKSLTLRAWKDFIEHIAHDYDGLYPEVQEVKILTEILKLLKLPDPNTHLMTLLHFVSSECDPLGNGWKQVVTLICSDCSQHFDVHPEGFKLLEHIETTFGSTKQSIESVYIEAGTELNTPSFSTALCSRLARQKEKLASFCCHDEVHISDKESAEALIALLEATEVNVHELRVEGDIGEDAWHKLARVLELRSNIVLGRMIVSDYIVREVFVERMKDDIKRILDSTSIIIYWDEDWGWSMWTKLKEISRYTEAEYTDWESMWTRLKEISKMTGAEYIADVKKARQVKVAAALAALEESSSEEETSSEDERSPEENKVKKPIFSLKTASDSVYIHPKVELR